METVDKKTAYKEGCMRMDEIITTVSSQKKNQNNITKIFEIRITSQI